MYDALLCHELTLCEAVIFEVYSGSLGFDGLVVEESRYSVPSGY